MRLVLFFFKLELKLSKQNNKCCCLSQYCKLSDCLYNIIILVFFFVVVVVSNRTCTEKNTEWVASTQISCLSTIFVMSLRGNFMKLPFGHVLTNWQGLGVWHATQIVQVPYNSCCHFVLHMCLWYIGLPYSVCQWVSGLGQVSVVIQHSPGFRMTRMYYTTIIW